MTSKHDTLQLLLKLLMLGSALAAFSSYGFAEDIDFGKMNYESNCAACHGPNGKGDGPVSAELRTKPSDLTLIAKETAVCFQPMSSTESSMEGND